MKIVLSQDVVLLATLMLASGLRLVAQKQHGCYAFLKGGDINITCQGTTAAVTHRGDVRSFGVNEERLTLAYVTWRVVVHRPGTDVIKCPVSLVDLDGRITHAEGACKGGSKHVRGDFPRGAGNVRSTCRARSHNWSCGHSRWRGYCSL